MMQSRAQLATKLYKYPKKDILSEEGSHLPEAYKKFYREWVSTPKPVHFKPLGVKWIRNDETGEVKRHEDVPVPLLFPPESHYGIWGGEGVIRGFQKRTRTKQRVPHFWIPHLKKSAVYSEVLDKRMQVTVTERTIDLIMEHKGFDHYLLGTKACDLQSSLALKIKQKILKALYYKDLYKDDPMKNDEVYNKYKHYLEGFTEEDIEWYGLPFDEALIKFRWEQDSVPSVPLKVSLRRELILKLLEHKDKKNEEIELNKLKEQSWISRFNPFSSRGSKEKD